MLDIQYCESALKRKRGSGILVFTLYADCRLWNNWELSDSWAIAFALSLLNLCTPPWRFERIRRCYVWKSGSMISTERVFRSKGHFLQRVNPRSHTMQSWIKLCQGKSMCSEWPSILRILSRQARLDRPSKKGNCWLTVLLIILVAKIAANLIIQSVPSKCSISRSAI
jgi:hypothetical protein